MSKILCDADAVSRMIARLSHEIVERNDNIDDVVLVGVLRRGVPIAERISEKIFSITGKTVPVGTLDITLYRDDLEEIYDAPSVNAHEIGVDVKGKTVILVDDVIYTGRTVRAAIDAVFDSDRPRKIELVELVDRGHREIPIRPDYVGKNVPTSHSEQIQVKTEKYDGEWCVILKQRDE
ncbi:MAG: bifunctional pyr operon transcriptional regulator/uracil phosphoribosyltransferase PyrR [Clostridiales bacterium]|nr:bifunctional pyr operon transcriptional regulator/uracil phosphoribosyltransferase PyrR [Clostridiales bacterium]